MKCGELTLESMCLEKRPARSERKKEREREREREKERERGKKLILKNNESEHR